MLLVTRRLCVAAWEANVGCGLVVVMITGLVRWEIEADEVWFATAVAMRVARLVGTASERWGVQAIALGME